MPENKPSLIRIFKRLGQPELLPLSWRLWIVILALIVNLILMVALYPALGAAVTAAIAFPVFACAWFFGFRAANLSFLVISILDFLFFYWRGLFNLETFLRSNGLTGALLLLASAAFIGRMSDLRREAVKTFQKQQAVENILATNQSLTEALIASSAAINSSLELNDVLDKILAGVGSVVPHTAANIMLIEGDQARIVRARGYEVKGQQDFILTIHYSVHDHFNLRHLAQTAQPIAISYTHSDPRWFDTTQMNWIESYASAPIIIQNRVVGFLNLDSDIPGYYTQEHADRLMAFANQAAVAINNAHLYDQAQTRARQAALLNEMSHAALSAPSLPEMAKAISERLFALYGAFGTYITLWDEKKRFPIPTAATGFMSEDYPSMELPPNEYTLTHMAVDAGEILAIPDAGQVPGLSRLMRKRFPGHAMLVLPLISNQKPLGAAIIVYSIGRQITPSEVALAQTLASQISLAIAKAVLLNSEQARLQEINHTNQLLSLLGRMATRVATEKDFQSVLVTLGQELQSEGVSCLVALKDEQEAKGLFISYFSRQSELPEKWQRFIKEFSFFRPDFSFFSTIMDKGQPLYIAEPIDYVHSVLLRFPDYARDTLTRLFGFNSATHAICLPLVAEEKVLGVIILWGDDLRESDQPAALIFANQVAIALQKASLISAIQHMAITDDLTGVLNRRGLYEIGQREVERAQRFNHPLTLLFIDLDLFKNINDLFGHNIGDEVILQVANRIRSNIREFDVVGRFGGDEFLVLLIESDAAKSLEIAERLRADLQENPIRTSVGLVQASMSIGLAQLCSRAPNLDDLIIQADRNLYQAKSEGRNRIITRQLTGNPPVL